MTLVRTGDRDGLGSDHAPAYYVASVGRVLTLIEAFSDRSQLTVSEAASVLHVSPSTAHRLLRMLVHHNFVVQGDHRVYYRGRAMDAIGTAVAPGADIIAIAKPHLIALQRDLRATTHLVALEGTGARFLAASERRDDGERLSVRSHVGWLLPAYTTAGGKALLARLSGELLQSLFPDGVPITRNGRIQSVRQLRTELRLTRQREYGRSVHEAHHDIVSLGVALPTEIPISTFAVSAAWNAAAFAGVDEAYAVSALGSTARDILDECVQNDIRLDALLRH